MQVDGSKDVVIYFWGRFRDATLSATLTRNDTTEVNYTEANFVSIQERYVGLKIPKEDFAGNLPATIVLKRNGSDYRRDTLEAESSGDGGVGDAHTTATNNPHGVTKNQVGLGAVDNTSDADKPISTAQQTALDGKAATTHNHDSSYAPVAHTTDTNNPHAVTKTQVGLGNVDNTSDLNKPISTATQAALDGKATTAHNHNASYAPLAGSKTFYVAAGTDADLNAAKLDYETNGNGEDFIIVKVAGT